MTRKLICGLIVVLISFTVPIFSAPTSSTEIALRDSIYKVMDEYEIHHQDIVYAQAVLETGHFKSKLCKKGNLFGLRGKKGYYHFNHWSESVKMYKEKIQSRYREGEDYYNFLKRIHYASSPNYTKLLKRIVDGTNNRSRQSSKRNK